MQPPPAAVLDTFSYAVSAAFLRLPRRLSLPLTCADPASHQVSSNSPPSALLTSALVPVPSPPLLALGSLCSHFSRFLRDELRSLS